MILYYYSNQWNNGPPNDKKAKSVETDLPKPKYRPGRWVKFIDPQICPDIGELVGKIAYVVVQEEDGKRTVRYEIRHGYSQHSISVKNILCKMVAEETE